MYRNTIFITSKRRKCCSSEMFLRLLLKMNLSYFYFINSSILTPNALAIFAMVLMHKKLNFCFKIGWRALAEGEPNFAFTNWRCLFGNIRTFFDKIQILTFNCRTADGNPTQRFCSPNRRARRQILYNKISNPSEL